MKIRCLLQDIRFLLMVTLLLQSGVYVLADSPDTDQSATIKDVHDSTAVKPLLYVQPFTHRGSVDEAEAGVILADLLLQEASSDRYQVADEPRFKPLADDRVKAVGTPQGVEPPVADKRNIALVVGELSGLGPRYYLDVRLVDFRTEQVIRKGHVEFASFDEINAPLRDLARQLGLSHPDTLPPAEAEPGVADDQPPGKRIESLYLDGTISQDQTRLGMRLLEANTESLNEFDTRRLAYFKKLLDGSLPAGRLQRALDLVDYAEQNYHEEIRQVLDLSRQTKIRSLLAKVRLHDNNRDRSLALLTLDEILELEPYHPEAGMLRSEIMMRTPPSKVGDTWTNSIGITFAYIPAGKFMMGSSLSHDEVRRILDYDPNRFNDEYPRHRVVLSKAFGLATTEVTIEQFAQFIRETGFKTIAELKGSGKEYTSIGWADKQSASWKDPGFEQSDHHPVVQVSWHDAVAFTNWLSKREGRNYRLPSEAEWEYACRAGTSSIWTWGDTMEGGIEHANMADEAAERWIGQLGKTYTHRGRWEDGFMFTAPVRSFEPNAWGLYDMQGNALEICFDAYDKYPNQTVVDPTGPNGGARRVSRGGSWTHAPAICRPARRHKIWADYRSYHLGFRIALDWDAEHESSTQPTSSPGRR